MEGWGRPETLERHFQDHGKDFGVNSARDYARIAKEFCRRRGEEGALVKVDGKGVVRIYDPMTNTFGAYNRDGTTRTFFKPRAGKAYFDKQPPAALEGRRRRDR